MKVTFTKAAGRRYFMTIEREVGVRLEPRQGPGYHDYLPHYAVHLIVESEAGLSGGVFGRLARGENNIFVASDSKVQRRSARREARRSRPPADREDMARSEALASICLPLWELRAGHRTQLPAWAPADLPSVLATSLMDRIMTSLDEFAQQWSELPVGGRVTLTWARPAQRRFASPSAARTDTRRQGAGVGRLPKTVRAR
jgi:hypothetical protein